MDFPALISALQDPGVYPEIPPKVELIQTHISAVFLTGTHAYKIKKPVNFGFLDFATLEKRRFYCEREVELNRRLCPEVYLGVLEIRSHGGRISLGKGLGEVIEYAVWMKELPAECMLDRWLSEGKIDSAWLRKIAAKIVRFHAEADATPEIARFGEIDTIRGNMEENFSQTERYAGSIVPPDVMREIQDANRIFLDRQEPLFRKRIAEGRIRDGHGDLHLQHICLGEDILIFDCIEFNERFRYGDVAADIAFLLMDLDFHGYGDFAAELASDYLQYSRDWSLFRLLDFYKSYRAYVRAKVSCFRLDDPSLGPKEKDLALRDGRRYFTLAHHYARRLNRPLLIVTCGLMGTGKSTIARALSEALDWTWLSSDGIRKELAGLSPDAHRREKFGAGIYAPEVSERTYQALFDRTQSLLAMGRSVILDASFQRARDRKRALEEARRTEAEFLLLECRLDDEVTRVRWDRRGDEGQESSDGRWEIFADQKKEFDAVSEIPAELHLPLNTEASREENLRIIFHHLLHRAGRTLPELGV